MNGSTRMNPLSKCSIKNLDLQGKPLFLRVDFNVPLEGGCLVDDARIKAVLPTIELAVAKKARVVLASHLGRPDGRWQKEFSLLPVAHYLSQLSGREVAFSEDCIGDKVEEDIRRLEPGKVLLLENLRFHEGEIRNDPEFSQRLCRWAKAYVNDSFGSIHRAHSSIVGVPKTLGKGAVGLLVEKELKNLSRVLTNPEKPVVLILGVAKISDKIDVIKNLFTLADSILIGGGMASTFLKSQGLSVGESILEKDKLDVANNLISGAESMETSLKLPVDHVVAQSCEPGVFSRIVGSSIPKGWMALDIGPKTLAAFKKEILQAKTVIWNGPVGVFEIDDFAYGTMEVARTVAASKAFSVVGGGDSAAAVKKAGVENKITHLSTGGGAALEFLARKELPGLEILSWS